MARKAQREAVFAALKRSLVALSATDIARLAAADLPQRTLRRWLSGWTAEGLIVRSGIGRSTRYLSVAATAGDTLQTPSALGFLRGLDTDLRIELLAQIRDLWTYTSTALEGNTLTLGDTHFVLQEGLTISGKPIKDHEEVVGHSRAIDLLYRCLNEPLTESIVLELHKSIQTEQVTDIYKPNGAWKVAPNGTHMVAEDGRQVFIEYAMPSSVAVLMDEVIEFTNTVNVDSVTELTAHEYYAKIHMGVVHIHPFWDGNGRVARLLANIPLLKAGLPPLTIPAEQRRAYIQLLANYQIAVGQLNITTGVWPEQSLLSDFSRFCESSYFAMQDLIAAACDVQKRRA